MGAFQRKPEREGAEGTAAGGEAASAGGLGGRLGSLVQKSGGWMDRVAGSVKDAARKSLLKQAIDARERGNLAAAFHLVKEEFGNLPDEPDVASFYWDVAVAYERAGEAVMAVSSLIRRNAVGGTPELATQYWVEMNELVPGSVLDAVTLARLVPHLAEQVEADRREASEEANADYAKGAAADAGEEEEEDPERLARREARRARESALLAALRGIVDERNREALTAGLAMHVAELARSLDPETALAAARHALGCDDVHEAKRDRLRTLIHELDPDSEPPPEREEPEAAPAPGETPADDPPAEDMGDDTSDAEHPARNHPLREPALEEKEEGGLSDEEVAKLRSRLPPSRPVPSAEADDDAKSGAAEETEPAEELAEAEIVAEAVAEPAAGAAQADPAESVAGADREPDVDILGDSAPELEVDDLDTSHPELEVDVDVLAQSFPELQIQADAAVAAGNPAPADGADAVETLEASVELEAEVEVQALEPAAADEVDEDVDCMIEALAPEIATGPDAVGSSGVAGAPASEGGAAEAPIPVDPSLQAPLHSDLKCMPGRPRALEGHGLVIEVSDGRRARIDLRLVQAIAVGEVAGLSDAPVLVIDLLMDQRDAEGAPLRVVRLRGDEFDPTELVADESDAGAALRSLLATLLERTSAIPLPDPDAALGLVVPHFDTLEAYERGVLQVQR